MLTYLPVRMYFWSLVEDLLSSSRNSITLQSVYEDKVTFLCYLYCFHRGYSGKGNIYSIKQLFLGKLQKGKSKTFNLGLSCKCLKISPFPKHSYKVLINTKFFSANVFNDLTSLHMSKSVYLCLLKQPSVTDM